MSKTLHTGCRNLVDSGAPGVVRVVEVVLGPVMGNPVVVVERRGVALRDHGYVGVPSFRLEPLAA